MWWVVYWGFIVLWLIGCILEGETRTPRRIHEAYRKMWVTRFSAFSCMVVTMMSGMRYWDGWSLWNTLYTMFMFAIFYRNAYFEYTYRGDFIALYHKYENEISKK